MEVMEMGLSKGSKSNHRYAVNSNQIKTFYLSFEHIQ
jgi:hypothetical protein